jgi:hypothetical protein
MAQLPRTAPQLQRKDQRSSRAFFYVEVFVCILLYVAFVSGAFFAIEAVFGRQTATPITHAAQLARHVQAKLNIIVNQPGYQQDWPAFAPNNLVVPANSLVTITLHDYDLGLDTPLANGSPFATVQGTFGGVAYRNGQPFASLAPAKIAHTFTIPQLHINVPLPGDGKESDTISFTFHTGKAGTYLFQCFAPCGTGSSGFEGPMATKGYMVGTLTVQ